MKARLLFACLVLLGASAFAPAPFPRTQRPSKDTVAVAQIQGTWTILKLHLTDDKGGLIDQGDYLSEIVVANNRWNFHYRQGRNAPTTYQLTIDAGKTPATIDLTQIGQTTPYGTGIIRRKGDSMWMLYSFGKQRPTSFENRPNGYWHLTLQRKR
jgi:uncharacterized protein (TIGR03067 family)